MEDLVLSGISPLITPEIYEVLYRMGHQDELVIADANIRASVLCPRVIHSGCTEIDALLLEILRLIPLDDDEPDPVLVMANDYDRHEPVLMERYQALLGDLPDGRAVRPAERPREAFYARVQCAYAVIQTADARLMSNIILRKGVVL